MSAAGFSHDLDEHLETVLAPEGAPSDQDIIEAAEGVPWADEPWRPEDESAADWVARKALRAAQTLAAKQAQRDRLVAQADAWLASERKRLDSTIAWAEGLLADWLAGEIDADPKGKKSRELPCGVVVKRTAGRTTTEIVDLEAFKDWAEGNGHVELLRIKVEPDKRELNKLPGDPEDGFVVDPESGERIPGLGRTVSPDSYRLDIPGGA